MKRFSVVPSWNNNMAEEDDLYFSVCVYKTRSGMTNRWRQILPNDCLENEWRLLRAGVLPATLHPEGDKLSPCLGLALFCEQHMNVGIIAHEAVHMATEYVRAKRLPLTLGKHVCDNEERIAYAAGTCANQLANFIFE